MDNLKMHNLYRGNLKNRNIVLGVAIIVVFVLLIFSISAYMSFMQTERQSSRLEQATIENMTQEEHMEYIYERQSRKPGFPYSFMMPLMAFIGMLIGVVVYYVMSDKVMHQDTQLRKNTKIILNFLNPEERKVIDILLENEGKVQQYELSRLPDLNKVKTHRILLKLERKGVIKKEKLGKINKIILNRELYEVLKE